MKIVQIKIENFRGIRKGQIFLNEHTVLVGDNNSGKSTVLEAIDLVLGPERLARRPIIDEHDFYAGTYIDAEGEPVKISIEVIIVDLSDEQTRRFKDNLEWWDEGSKELLQGPPPESTDQSTMFPALRISFSGWYDKEEDDFKGETYFMSPTKEEGDTQISFKVSDKRMCGFLFLRTYRTGSRALSLE